MLHPIQYSNGVKKAKSPVSLRSLEVFVNVYASVDYFDLINSYNQCSQDTHTVSLGPCLAEHGDTNHLHEPKQLQSREAQPQS